MDTVCVFIYLEALSTTYSRPTHWAAQLTIVWVSTCPDGAATMRSSDGLHPLSPLQVMILHSLGMGVRARNASGFLFLQPSILHPLR